MLYPIKVADIELSEPLETITGLDKYLGLHALVRLHGTPIGYIDLPVTNGQIEAPTISKEILEKHNIILVHNLLQNGLYASATQHDICIEHLLNLKPAVAAENMPLVTVAVCSRNRTADLDLCLSAISYLDYPHLEVIVVDNAPSTNETQLLINNYYPFVRYICEPRPGLDWARNRAIAEASGEIIAFTDDDVIVDKGWVKAIALLMMEHPEIMAITGLVVPYELETEAQLLFEKHGGFGRGFKRKWHKVNNCKVPWQLLGTGQFGTGANMAYRLSVFEKIGCFDPALDVGTVTNGGGDLEMFFRILKEGYTLVYEPSAIVRHRHRREYEKLKNQLRDNSKGLLSYMTRSIKAYPDQRYSFLRLWRWWIHIWLIKRLTLGYFRASGFPSDLTRTELLGCFGGTRLYKKARKNAAVIASKYGSVTDLDIDRPKPSRHYNYPVSNNKTAIRKINIGETLQPITDVIDYAKVHVYVSWNDVQLGYISISNLYAPISKTVLSEEIAHQLSFRLLNPAGNLNEHFKYADAMKALQNHFYSNESEIKKLPVETSVSVVVATYDRPADLHRCLSHLVLQESLREIEIIVVDNNPASGLTKPVVAAFNHVILINETKKGLSFARNAGIHASKGEIIISTDDDVVVPPNWVESLVAPFIRSDVMVVTGNVLPFELESTAQHFFEVYGGLGRDFQKIEFNTKWFESFKRHAVPTWKIGACANAAFRAGIFKHPQIGMLDEALGAGTPTGCSEDTYVFYKVLKQGYTIVYEPNAFVWHRHRTNMKAFSHQVYNYSKGHVAYHFKTWLEHKDWRGLYRIFMELPLIHIKRFYWKLTGKSIYPASMTWLEVKGNIMGLWALILSEKRAKKLKRNDLQYIWTNNPKNTSTNSPKKPITEPVTIVNK